jgi:predicted glycosyltransferase involved in capsule biosynthesis
MESIEITPEQKVALNAVTKKAELEKIQVCKNSRELILIYFKEKNIKWGQHA